MHTLGRQRRAEKCLICYQTKFTVFQLSKEERRWASVVALEKTDVILMLLT